MRERKLLNCMVWDGGGREEACARWFTFCRNATYLGTGTRDVTDNAWAFLLCSVIANSIQALAFLVVSCALKVSLIRRVSDTIVHILTRLSSGTGRTLEGMAY